MRGCRNKSPTKLNVVENKINTSDLFTNRENHQGKTPPCEFKVTIPENPLLSKQVVTSKKILIPYTNLQLNPYPNTQLDLFCSDNLSFSMHSSYYVTNQSMNRSKYMTNTPTWEGCWLQSSSVHPHDEDQEGHWLYNSTVQTQQLLQEKDELGHMSLVIVCLQQQVQQPLHLLASSVMTFKIVFIYA